MMQDTIDSRFEAAVQRLVDALASQRLTINHLDDGSGVLLDVEGEQLLTLNCSALALIEALRDGARSEHDLATSLTRRFDVSAGRAREDAKAFVDNMARAM